MKTTGPTQKSLPMFAESEEDNLNMSISSLADSRVKTSLVPGKDRVFSMAHALVFGSSSPGLLANYDHEQSCWKMSPGLRLQEKKKMGHLHRQTWQWLLIRWPKWGMTHDGALSRLPMPERRMSANDGSAWPTPRAQERKQQNSRDNGMALSKAVTIWPTPTADDVCNRQPPENVHVTGNGTLKIDNKHKSHVRLSQTVKYYEEKTDWHTPIANDAIKTGAVEPKRENGLSAQVKWATPQARDWKNSNKLEDGRTQRKLKEGRTIDLNDQVQIETELEGELNPRWEEILIGFPPGWTEID